MENTKEPNWAGDPHQDWKTRVADENRLIVVNGLNQVIMIADSMETLMEWWPRNVKKYTHARVYREIDISAELEAAELEKVAREEKEAHARLARLDLLMQAAECKRVQYLEELRYRITGS